MEVEEKEPEEKEEEIAKKVHLNEEVIFFLPNSLDN